MSDSTRAQRLHELDVTVWVGKKGLDPVEDELNDQLQEADFVKVKFLRSSRGGTTSEDLAADLAERVNAEVVRSRGHTAIFER